MLFFARAINLIGVALSVIVVMLPRIGIVAVIAVGCVPHAAVAVSVASRGRARLTAAAHDPHRSRQWALWLPAIALSVCGWGAPAMLLHPLMAVPMDVGFASNLVNGLLRMR